MLGRRTAITGTLATASVFGLARPSLAAPGVFTKDGYALGGYDTANYWTVNKASMGKVAYNTQWNGVNWLFATERNLNTFLASPDKYAPQFNGYCPFCLAGGRLVPGVGNLYSLYHDKLYLLLSDRIKTDFDHKSDYYIERATTYWAKLS